MLTRATQSLFDPMAAAIRRHTAELHRLQQQAASGLRLLRPSDSPIDILKVMANRVQDQRFDTQLANLRDSRATLNMSVSTLIDVSNLFNSTRGIALEGANATSDLVASEALASEVDALLDRLIDLANTQQGGRSLFGGMATTPSLLEKG